MLYSYDDNAILSEPLRSRTGKDILHVYITCHEYLKERVFNPKTYWLDNEWSNNLNKYYCNQEVEFQLVPPGVHQQNAAEYEIQTYKITSLQDYSAQILNLRMHKFFTYWKNSH